eukprot:8619155-Ditylum_brightwellii.AAC.1
MPPCFPLPRPNLKTKQHNTTKQNQTTAECPSSPSIKKRQQKGRDSCQNSSTAVAIQKKPL